MISLKLTLNGDAVSVEVEPGTLLVELLRDHLGLTGTHVGCDTSRCGACVVQCPMDALAFEDTEGHRVEPDTIRRYKLNLLGQRSVGV